MDCTEARNLSEDYVYGLLDPDKESFFKNHIDSCPDCRRAVENSSNRKELLGSWKVQTLQGAGDRLFERIRKGEYVRKPVYGSPLVRIMAAAAVILAAFVIPNLFFGERQEVLGYQARTTSVEGIFNDFLNQELTIPENFLNSAYIVVRLKSIDDKMPVKASICLNDSEGHTILTNAAISEEVYILTRDNGLKGGKNLLSIKNLGTVPLEFEVTLMIGRAM